jgi:hypothetical protein
MALAKYVWTLAVLLTSLGSAAGLGMAQDAAPFQVQGRVAWIAGQKLIVVPDGSPAIHVDLSQVPQDQHGKLREGDRVVVTGAVPNERNRLVASTVERLGP